jgi:hypothetical protein
MGESDRPGMSEAFFEQNYYVTFVMISEIRQY